jgi:leucyl aminopeptidase
MQIQLLTEPIETLEADALVVVAFEKQNPGGVLNGFYESGEFKGKFLDTALLHAPAGWKARRLLAVGGGPAEQLGAAELRKVAGTAVRFLKPKGVYTMALALVPGYADAEQVSATVEGAVLGDFEPDRYKTDKEDSHHIDTFSVAVASADETLEAALRRGRIIAEAQNFTRNLVAEPSNRMTPSILADRAREMAAAEGLEYEVLDRARMEQLGMGALLGVAQGSHEPPCLIVVRYQPPAVPVSTAHIALVGKGVTFDSGGISIKPSAGMDEMKSDMAGGAAVLGAMRAIAQLQPEVPVTALIPAVENMPGGGAQRPGDIVKTLSGKTVEVLNTDAEGRLILADALTYARNLGCTHLVDAATLTGAIVVALGHFYVGAFSNDDTLAEQLLLAAKAAGEKMWRMPLDDDYKEMLKSTFADLPNVANRWGGAITASMFLKEFAGTTPWVHLDIAGMAWLEESKPFLAKGPSGLPVRTFVNLVTRWAE